MKTTRISILFITLLSIAVSSAAQQMRLQFLYEDSSPAQYLMIQDVNNEFGFIADSNGVVSLKTQNYGDHIKLVISGLNVVDTVITVDFTKNEISPIYVQKRLLALKPALIEAKYKKPKIEKIGITGRFMTTELGFAIQKRTILMASYMEAPATLFYIKSINIAVKRIYSDSFYVGFNFREVTENGFPGDKILDYDIITTIPNDGWVSINVSKYYIQRAKPFFITWEILSPSYNISDKKNAHSVFAVNTKLPSHHTNSYTYLEKEGKWVNDFLEPVIYCEIVDMEK